MIYFTYMIWFPSFGLEMYAFALVHAPIDLGEQNVTHVTLQIIFIHKAYVKQDVAFPAIIRCWASFIYFPFLFKLFSTFS